MVWLNSAYDSGGWRRSLAPHESDLFAEHLLRLPAEDRRSRFLHEVSDEIIREHAHAYGPSDRRVIGWFRGGKLRGAVELDFSGEIAEAAITVEPEFRGAGVATGLMQSALRAASNRGAKKVIVRTSRENKPMLQLAKTAGARFRVEEGDLTGEIDAKSPTPVSYIFDCAEERSGLLASIASAVMGLISSPWRESRG